jgi:hypothetical protein
MSLNPQGEGKSLYDVLEGSVSSYFTRLAGVLQRNESVNGQYTTTISSCYASNTPVTLPNFTRVCMSTNGSTVLDLANSFIEMELEYELTTTTNIAKAENAWFFVGFKNSIEALSRYDIYVNSSKIYSQSWVGQESFIYNAGISQQVREKSPYVYTCSKNAKMRSNDVCGTYVRLDTAIAAGHNFRVKIPVKINLHQILMLSSVRYLPSFCGRWEIELYPSAENLVFLPCAAEACLNQMEIWKALATGLCDPYVVEQSFTQIGKPFKMWSAKLDAAAWGTQNITLNSTGGTLLQCLMSQTTFQLRYEVFEGLRSMYADQPLIIPTNILTYGRFSGKPSGKDDGHTFHATLSQSLENCDSIFVLVPHEEGQRTCFYNPYLRELRLSLGEFGTKPQRYVQTWNDPRFLAMCLDALNLETSDILTMNDDVARSLNGDRTHELIQLDSVGKPISVNTTGDKSNFFIGFSLSQVGFQSGTVSSPNTNVPFMFDAVLDRTTVADLIHTDAKEITTSIVVMFLIDAAIMIQVIPDSDVPVVKLTSKSIV